MQVTRSPAVDTSATPQVPLFGSEVTFGGKDLPPEDDTYCNVKLKVSTPCTFTGTPESSVGLKTHCRAA